MITGVHLCKVSIVAFSVCMACNKGAASIYTLPCTVLPSPYLAAYKMMLQRYKIIFFFSLYLRSMHGCGCEVLRFSE